MKNSPARPIILTSYSYKQELKPENNDSSVRIVRLRKSAFRSPMYARNTDWRVISCHAATLLGPKSTRFSWKRQSDWKMYVKFYSDKVVLLIDLVQQRSSLTDNTQLVDFSNRVLRGILIQSTSLDKTLTPRLFTSLRKSPGNSEREHIPWDDTIPSVPASNLQINDQSIINVIRITHFGKNFTRIYETTPWCKRTRKCVDETHWES